MNTQQIPQLNLPTGVNDLTATRLRNCWAIKPRNTCGTCGWIDGKPWTVEYTKHKPAHIPEEPNHAD